MPPPTPHRQNKDKKLWRKYGGRHKILAGTQSGVWHSPCSVSANRPAEHLRPFRRTLLTVLHLSLLANLLYGGSPLFREKPPAGHCKPVLHVHSGLFTRTLSIQATHFPSFQAGSSLGQTHLHLRIVHFSELQILAALLSYQTLQNAEKFQDFSTDTYPKQVIQPSVPRA